MPVPAAGQPIRYKCAGYLSYRMVALSPKNIHVSFTCKCQNLPEVH